MTRSNWIVAGAALCGLGVVSGAFGAHALEARLEAAGELETWRTAVRYQVWHGLALLALSTASVDVGRRTLVLFVVGTLCFSGSIYGLALGGPGAVLGPVTPLGGTLLIVAWVAVAAAALRAPRSAPGGEGPAGPHA